MHRTPQQGAQHYIPTSKRCEKHHYLTSFWGFYQNQLIVVQYGIILYNTEFPLFLPYFAYLPMVFLKKIPTTSLPRHCEESEPGERDGLPAVRRPKISDMWCVCWGINSGKIGDFTNNKEAFSAAKIWKFHLEKWSESMVIQQDQWWIRWWNGWFGTAVLGASNLGSGLVHASYRMLRLLTLLE